MTQQVRSNGSSRPGIAILGATGSVGLNTLNVIGQHKDALNVVALTAHRDWQGLLGLCRIHKPEFAVLADEAAANELHGVVREEGLGTEVLGGTDALKHVATLDQVDYVMAAIVGGAGLPPAFAAAESGKRVMLANKEALVMAGRLFLEAINDNGAVLLPVDSEHSAIFQCMPPRFRAGDREPTVRRIIITASGGPFRKTPLSRMGSITPEQACAHPNWSMGPKISVDSATMMNKGLEVIEACWLFAASPEEIDVVIHPQSIVHSLVEFVDGSVLAQMGPPDMKIPIAYALGWPDRLAVDVQALDLVTLGRLDFDEPNNERFPCLSLAASAWSAGGTGPAILNAANEVAVQGFLDEKIGFVEIASTIADTLDRCEAHAASSLDIVLDDDRKAREIAQGIVDRGVRRAAR